MDVIVGKVDSIRRCLNRIHEEYFNNQASLFNFTKQDSIILNLQRACELCIDISNHIIRKYKFEIPKISKESFEILELNNIITVNLSKSMQEMVGFRNIAIHDYKKLDIRILEDILKNHLTSFDEFIKKILDYIKNNQSN